MKRLHVVLTNEDKGYRYYDDLEDLPWWASCEHEDGSLNLGALFKALQEEYGRCTSKVYVDTSDGIAHIGWYFEKRKEYDDAWRYNRKEDKTYLQGCWVTVVEYEAATTRAVHLAAA